MTRETLPHDHAPAGQLGAKIIPFPGGPDRLARALAALNRAVEEERTAIAAWRESLASLDRTVTGVAGSLQDYRSALDTLAVGVADLHQVAVRTERAL